MPGVGYRVDPGEPVFTDAGGARVKSMAATDAFRELARRAGVTTTSLHSARHTAATNLIAGGVDVRTTASLLGQTTPNVTLALYSHVVEGAERALSTRSPRLTRRGS